MGLTEFRALTATHGFAYSMAAGTAVALPPNCMIIEHTTGPAHGLRWTIWGSELLMRTSRSLLQEFCQADELSKTPLKEVMQHLPNVEPVENEEVSIGGFVPLPAIGNAGRSVENGDDSSSD